MKNYLVQIVCATMLIACQETHHGASADIIDNNDSETVIPQKGHKPQRQHASVEDAADIEDDSWRLDSDAMYDEEIEDASDESAGIPEVTEEEPQALPPVHEAPVVEAPAPDEPSNTCAPFNVSITEGFTIPEDRVIAPFSKFGNGMGFEVLMDSPLDGPTLRVTSATVCQVDPNGDVADFGGVVLGHAGTRFAKSSSVNESCWTLTPTPDADFELPPGLGRLVWVGGCQVPIVSSTDANGAWQGVARSGHTAILQLKDVTFTSVEDDCTEKVDVYLQSNRMLFRKTQPFVRGQALPSTTLVEGVEMDLAKWSVMADAKPLEYIRSAFHTKITAGAAVQKLSLYRNDVAMAPNSYRIVGPCTNADNTAYICDKSSHTDERANLIYLQFTRPETVTDTVTYTLRGTPIDVTSETTLEVWLDRVKTDIPVTGQLISLSIIGPSLLPTPWYPEHTPPGFVGTFIWSDVSETPHSHDWRTTEPEVVHDRTSESSNDWTNDLWLDISDMSWTFSS